MMVPVWAVSICMLVGCEGNHSAQSNESQPQKVAQTNTSNGVYNVMQDENKFVMGACVELGYPLVVSKASTSSEMQSACLRNLTHKFEADTKKSDTKLKWRVRVKGVELQCECAGYATQTGRNGV
ncbi:hypothetical protein [Pseudoalteromonas luteoviolacea]|uniref:Uncharacterized protein n=2 Tax=Pseudoalteromonas luteoviolacea TaxID=43657 RepID=A0A0F6AF15_9GAMM|nr:hypothetical protein [Pseudoalteromonas luteoviolacea]KKE84800.1 hypothetical protein N479_07645 [Pseudoalteromonas luteoviolacea S4054]AOT08806.1 hypothetical protein S4054249_13500 [Pseudoalteromonas luteoviolacea]AOT13719.1 hypothetical protein S40542_13470 [Pseudoalteromonas luteoviolacea]AOT18633.1 hypothetical protein S4054_13475 [Pseudoalteromonas luteoviolacea]KZN72823.1 hypothetical protein N481_14450 [Pseudoalteromonas luteoviolacea S4047-1]